MSRYLLAAGICLAVGHGSSAAEPPRNPTGPRQAGHISTVPLDSSAGAPQAIAADASTVERAVGRKALESLLQSPANLQFGHRETITIKELLDQLHERHPLSIRFDMPTLSAMYGASHGGDLSAPVTAYNAPPIAVATVTAPIGTPITASPQVIPSAEATDSPAAQVVETQHSFLPELLNTEINIATIDLHHVSIATALRHALEALPTGDLGEEASGLPIALSNAGMFDYVLEDDGLLITSRLKALTYKETRVYSVKHLKDLKPEQLAVVIRQSIRPWSWRSRIDDLGEQLRVGGPRIPSKALAALFKSSVQLASAETGIDVNVSDAPADKSAAKPDAETLDSKEMAVLGDALVNGLVTFVHATLTTVEIMHYADPPTGSIQTLPGKLIITQSQAAHREIAELLKQLAEE
jgi:hypothetical protein